MLDRYCKAQPDATITEEDLPLYATTFLACRYEMRKNTKKS